MQPVYVVFAGVNGAGKSTFYRTGLWRTEDMPRTMTRVNSDEIVVAQGGDPASSADQLRAGREAVRLIEECLSRRRSFNQETTLTGHAVLRNMSRAREAGYRVVLYYIGVDTAAVALDRIAHRVAVGGHDIDEGGGATSLPSVPGEPVARSRPMRRGDDSGQHRRVRCPRSLECRRSLMGGRRG